VETTMRRQPRQGETLRYPINPTQVGINREMIPLMVRMVKEDHAKVRPMTLDIIQGSECGVREIPCQVQAIYNYVVERFFWIDDPVLEETLYWPHRFADEMKQRGMVYADCASVNTFLNALLGSIGIRGLFVLGSDGGYDHGEPMLYHVWTAVILDGRPFFLEPTAYLPAGEAHRYRKMFFVDPWE